MALCVIYYGQTRLKNLEKKVPAVNAFRTIQSGAVLTSTGKYSKFKLISRYDFHIVEFLKKGFLEIKIYSPCSEVLTPKVLTNTPYVQKC